METSWMASAGADRGLKMLATGWVSAESAGPARMAPTRRIHRNHDPAGRGIRGWRWVGFTQGSVSLRQGDRCDVARLFFNPGKVNAPTGSARPFDTKRERARSTAIPGSTLHPRLHPGFEEIQRQGSASKQLVVELTEDEPRSERRLRVTSEPLDP